MSLALQQLLIVVVVGGQLGLRAVRVLRRRGRSDGAQHATRERAATRRTRTRRRSRLRAARARPAPGSSRRRRRRQQVARAARGPAAPTGCQRSRARAARRPIIARPARGTAARPARSSYEPVQDLEHVVLGDTLREAYTSEDRKGNHKNSVKFEEM